MMSLGEKVSTTNENETDCRRCMMSRLRIWITTHGLEYANRTPITHMCLWLQDLHRYHRILVPTRKRMYAFQRLQEAVVLGILACARSKHLS
jgi:sulfite exporter TauE/SafE